MSKRTKQVQRVLWAFISLLVAVTMVLLTVLPAVQF